MSNRHLAVIEHSRALKLSSKDPSPYASPNRINSDSVKIGMKKNFAGGNGSKKVLSLPTLSVGRATCKYEVSCGLSLAKNRRPYMEDTVKTAMDIESLAGGNLDNDRTEQGTLLRISQGGGKYRRVNPPPHQTLERASLGHTHQTNFFAVFDGHGGSKCSHDLAEKVAQRVASEPSFSYDLDFAIRNAFRKIDVEFLGRARRQSLDDGSTAACVFQRGGRLWIANVGDSRVVLCKRNGGVALSTDHKPGLPSEEARIHNAGGWVETRPGGILRVNGVLAVSRAFGDVSLKPAVSAEPEIQHHTLTDGDEFLCLATDGLWDAVSNAEVASLVHREASTGNLTLQATSQKLITTAITRGSMDNISVVLVDLRPLVHRFVTSGTGAPGVSLGVTGRGGEALLAPMSHTINNTSISYTSSSTSVAMGPLSTSLPAPMSRPKPGSAASTISIGRPDGHHGIGIGAGVGAGVGGGGASSTALPGPISRHQKPGSAAAASGGGVLLSSSRMGRRGHPSVDTGVEMTVTKNNAPPSSITGKARYRKMSV